MTNEQSMQDGLLGAKAFGRGTTGRFRRKPTEIRAVQFTGDNFSEVLDFFGEGAAAGIYGPTEKNPEHLILTKAHGDKVPCLVGDWVIPDSKPNTFYPCKPDVFAITYDRIPDEA